MRKMAPAAFRRFSMGKTALMPLLACLFGLSGSAMGAVYGFLDQAPMRYFSAEDMAMMSAAMDTVLAAPDDNQGQTWRNDKTGHHGSVVSLRTFEQQGMRCRRLRIDNHAEGNDERSTADLCQVDGVWKVLRLPN
ncbi:MAG: RT0821/Lpp0805 family surface protein [Thiohalocapsa sp.]|jgi:surface antigen